MKEEIWKAVDGYEDYYEVSSFGRVRSVDRIVTYSNGDKHFYKRKIMKSFSDKDGYLLCNLSKNSKHNAPKIHRLVAQAFISNPYNLPQVNHKDEDKSNNCVDNLEWCDGKYNINYGTRNEKVAVYFSKTVLQLDINTGRVISEYKSARDAKRKLNIHQDSIYGCCNGKRKTAGGFKWKFKE